MIRSFAHQLVLQQVLKRLNLARVTPSSFSDMIVSIIRQRSIQIVPWDLKVEVFNEVGGRAATLHMTREGFEATLVLTSEPKAVFAAIVEHGAISYTIAFNAKGQPVNNFLRLISDMKNTLWNPSASLIEEDWGLQIVDCKDAVVCTASAKMPEDFKDVSMRITLDSEQRKKFIETAEFVLTGSIK